MARNDGGQRMREKQTDPPGGTRQKLRCNSVFHKLLSDHLVVRDENGGSLEPYDMTITNSRSAGHHGHDLLRSTVPHEPVRSCFGGLLDMWQSPQLAVGGVSSPFIQLAASLHDQEPSAMS